MSFFTLPWRKTRAPLSSAAWLASGRMDQAWVDGELADYRRFLERVSSLANGGSIVLYDGRRPASTADPVGRARTLCQLDFAEAIACRDSVLIACPCKGLVIRDGTVTWGSMLTRAGERVRDLSVATVHAAYGELRLTHLDLREVDIVSLSDFTLRLRN